MIKTSHFSHLTSDLATLTVDYEWERGMKAVRLAELGKPRCLEACSICSARFDECVSPKQN
jgi:hypothetical protein